MAVAFVQAAAGVAITTGTSTVSITGTTAHNLLVLHVLEDGSGLDWYTSTVTNVETMDGVTSSFEYLTLSNAVGSPTSAHHTLIVGRSTAGGTSSIDIVTGASGVDLFCRWYEFSGANLGTTMTNVFQNLGGGAGATSINDVGTGTTVNDTYTECGSSALACNFIAVNLNTTIAAFTGATGGTWAEAVAEFSSATGTAGMLSLQTASLTGAAAIDGGTVAISSAGWGNTGTAILQATVPGTTSGNILMLGVG